MYLSAEEIAKLKGLENLVLKKLKSNSDQNIIGRDFWVETLRYLSVFCSSELFFHGMLSGGSLFDQFQER